MKNPFAMMAIVAAAMSAAFRENKYRDAGIPLPTGGGRSRFAGKRQPAGTKMIQRFYRAKHGRKAADIEQAREWYANYLSDLDAKVRLQEAAKKAARQGRTLRMAA